MGALPARAAGRAGRSRSSNESLARSNLRAVFEENVSSVQPAATSAANGVTKAPQRSLHCGSSCYSRTSRHMVSTTSQRGCAEICSDHRQERRGDKALRACDPRASSSNCQLIYSTARVRLLVARSVYRFARTRHPIKPFERNRSSRRASRPTLHRRLRSGPRRCGPLELRFACFPRLRAQPQMSLDQSIYRIGRPLAHGAKCDRPGLQVHSRIESVNHE
jgi:hypothetical protein